jgi:hypothetical protein
VGDGELGVVPLRGDGAGSSGGGNGAHDAVFTFLEEGVDDADVADLLGGEFSFDDGEVDAADAFGAKVFLDEFERVFGFGEGDESGSFLVEAMDDPDLGAAAFDMLADMTFDESEDVIAIFVEGIDGEESGGFVDDDEIGVFVGDADAICEEDVATGTWGGAIWVWARGRTCITARIGGGRIERRALGGFSGHEESGFRSAAFGPVGDDGGFYSLEEPGSEVLLADGASGSLGGSVGGEDQCFDDFAVHGFEGVTDDHVDAFAGEFVASREFELVAGFEGEADHELLGSARGGDFGEEVGGGFEFEIEGLVVTTELTGEEGWVDLGAEVGDGGGHDEDIRRGDAGPEEGLEVGTRSEPVDGEFRRVERLKIFKFRDERNRASEERDVPESIERGLGECETHATRRTVADESHGIDGFVGWSGGDEQMAVLTGPGRILSGVGRSGSGSQDRASWVACVAERRHQGKRWMPMRRSGSW